MDVSYKDVQNTAIYCVLIAVTGLGSDLSDTWYLNPITDSGIYIGKCLSTMGNSSKGIAVLPNGCITAVVMFPMYGLSWIGAISLGDESSISSFSKAPVIRPKASFLQFWMGDVFLIGLLAS